MMTGIFRDDQNDWDDQESLGMTEMTSDDQDDWDDQG